MENRASPEPATAKKPRRLARLPTNCYRPRWPSEQPAPRPSDADEADHQLHLLFLRSSPADAVRAGGFTRLFATCSSVRYMHGACRRLRGATSALVVGSWPVTIKPAHRGDDALAVSWSSRNGAGAGWSCQRRIYRAEPVAAVEQRAWRADRVASTQRGSAAGRAHRRMLVLAREVASQLVRSATARMRASTAVDADKLRARCAAKKEQLRTTCRLAAPSTRRRRPFFHARWPICRTCGRGAQRLMHRSRPICRWPAAEPPAIVRRGQRYAVNASALKTPPRNMPARSRRRS